MIELPPLPDKPFGYVREEKNRGVPLEIGMVLAVDHALFDRVQMRAYGEACARAALEAAAHILSLRVTGDNNREDEEAKRCRLAVEALYAAEGPNHPNPYLRRP